MEGERIMLKDKVALVTGASRGIGRAIALELASCGATVLINYNGSRDRAQAVLDEISAGGGQGALWQCDVSDYEACGVMIQEIAEQYKKIDILVNNAGITRDNLILRMSEAEYDQVLNTNLKGAFNTIRHASRYFLKQKAGKIINISSVSGIMGNPGQANYAASKAGLIGLTKSVAKELGSRGICVNAIAPGFVETEMTAALGEKQLEKVKPLIPLGRMGRPEEIAGLAAFLAGPGGDYITGQVISVDGGLGM